MFLSLCIDVCFGANCVVGSRMALFWRKRSKEMK